MTFCFSQSQALHASFTSVSPQAQTFPRVVFVRTAEEDMLSPPELAVTYSLMPSRIECRCDAAGVLHRHNVVLRSVGKPDELRQILACKGHVTIGRRGQPPAACVILKRRLGIIKTERQQI